MCVCVCRWVISKCACYVTSRVPVREDVVVYVFGEGFVCVCMCVGRGLYVCVCAGG